MTIRKGVIYLGRYIASFGYDLWFFFFGDIRSRIMGLPYYKESKKYPPYLKEGNMVEAVRSFAESYCQGKGVDIGAGRWPLPGARAIEDGLENAYTIQEADASLDFVFSSHLFEHLEKPAEALKEWNRILRHEGIVFLYLPHRVCAMWHKGVNPQHLWEPDVTTVEQLLRDNGFTIEFRTPLPDGLLSFCVIGRKV